jgi:hypothetical protein
MNEYVAFQSFYSEDEASVLSELFSQAGIENVIVKGKPIADEVIIGQDMDNKIFVKIKSSDFNKANKILEMQITNNIAQLESDYYLYSFSNEELFEIISKPDEWSKQDFLLAKKMLHDRDVTLSEKDVSDMTWKRIVEIGKPEKGSPFWIAIGYILSLGGVLGFLFGLAYLNAKKILPDGTRVYVYDESTRNHGRNILIISCIFIIVDILAALGVSR